MFAPPIYDPEIPFVLPIPGGMVPGRLLRFKGYTTLHAHRFAINLQCGPKTDHHDDIALHLNFRFEERCVVRNHLTAMKWGAEDRSGGMPLVPGETFEVLLMCEPDSMEVELNGEHFCDFSHRVPYKRISHLNIAGDVTITMIGFEESGVAPQASTNQGVHGGAAYIRPPPPPSKGAPGYGAPRQGALL